MIVLKNLLNFHLLKIFFLYLSLKNLNSNFSFFLVEIEFLVVFLMNFYFLNYYYLNYYYFCFFYCLLILVYFHLYLNKKSFLNLAFYFFVHLIKPFFFASLYLFYYLFMVFLLYCFQLFLS